MKTDRRLVSYTETSLAKEQDFVGDEIAVFHREDSGCTKLYTEMSLEENWRTQPT